MIIGHGGNKQALAQRLCCPVDEIVDMSSNLNPLGPPERIKQFIVENVDKINCLPQPDAMDMRKGFATFHGLTTDQVVAGNGTTWFIYILPLALKAKKAMIVGPTYSDYKDACAMYEVEPRHFLTRPEEDFQLDIKRLSNEIGDADMVFLCNPNNPTGTLVTRSEIEWLLKQHPDVCFVLDESYLPFVENAESISMAGETQFSNLIVLSSMSKIFTIPGLRTGFLSASETICEKVMACYQPWSINALAQAVIVDIFSHPEQIPAFYEQTRAFVKMQKQLFLGELEQIPNIRCYPGNTYFILAQLLDGLNSKTLCQKVGDHKILVRDCENFTGLTDRFVRFSLKTQQENMNLARVLKSVLAHV